MENTIRYKPEVETVPQTGSTNNLERRQISTHSQWLYLCFGGKFFTGVYANLTLSFLNAEIPRWRTYTGSSYNFATENDITVIAAAAAMF